MATTKGDPERLRAYTARTLPRVRISRASASAYRAAVHRLLAAPSDLPVAVADRSSTILRELDDLELVDRGPSRFAAALELADRFPWSGLAQVPLGGGMDPGTPPRVPDAIAALEAALALPDADRIDAVRAAFDGLNGAELDAVADAVPWLVGSLDGAPPRVRYRANLLLIRAELDAVRGEHRRTGDGSLTARIRALEQLLEHRVDPVTMQEGPRRFLVFDPSGNGRVAEVFGDLDTADNVSISVPGMTSKLDGYFDGFSGDVRQLAREATSLDPSYAAIAWQGYDAPQGVGPVLQPDMAIDGAAIFDRFVAGLPQQGADTTFIGHSYGSRVLGEAIRRHQLEPAAVVFVGSPGVGVDHADDLGLPPGTPVFAARAPFDLIVTFGNHGADPTDPRFGATRIRTEHHALGDGVIWWHSSYYAPDSHALRNLALISVGHHDDVTVVQPTVSDRIVVLADGALGTVTDVRRRMTDRAWQLSETPWLPPEVRGALQVFAGTATVAERVTTTMLGYNLTVFDKVTDLAEDGLALAPQVLEVGRQRLADWADGTVDWMGERWSDGTGWVGDRWNDGTGWVGDRWSDGTGWVGDRVSDVTSWRPW